MPDLTCAVTAERELLAADKLNCATDPQVTA